MNNVVVYISKQENQQAPPPPCPAASIFQIRPVSGDLSLSQRSQVSISLCLNRLSFTALALPVYLSRLTSPLESHWC